MIVTKTLEHLYSRESIKTFTQKLFYYIEPSEMTGIAQKMLDIALVEKCINNSLKLNVKYLEEVQGMMINEQRTNQGEQSKKDDLLEAKRIFNVNIQRKKFLFLNSNNLIQECENGNELHLPITYKQNKMHQTDQYFKKILHGYRSKKERLNHEIKKEKDVIPYEQVRISGYVR